MLEGSDVDTAASGDLAIGPGRAVSTVGARLVQGWPKSASVDNPVIHTPALRGAMTSAGRKLQSRRSLPGGCDEWRGEINLERRHGRQTRHPRARPTAGRVDEDPASDSDAGQRAIVDGLLDEPAADSEKLSGLGKGRDVHKDGLRQGFRQGSVTSLTA